MKHLKRIVGTTLLLLALLPASSPCFAQSGKPSEEPPPPPAAEYSPRAWREFTPAGARFSVLLPGVPSEEVRKLETALGQLDMHAIYLHSAADYAIFYADYPQRLEDSRKSKQALDGGRDEGVKNVQGRVLEEKDITLEGHPGRYLRIEAANGLTIRSKLILVDNRLYNLAAFTYDKGAPAAILKFHAEIASKFLDSFKLLNSADIEGAMPKKIANDKGKLIEKEMYQSSGELWIRYVNVYSGNQMQRLAYSADGSLNQKSVQTLDAQGRSVEETYYDVNTDAIEERYSYTYDSYDAQGNWTKFTTYKWVTKDGKGQFVPDYVTYRTITYY
jgi:hypothetical protein